MKTANRVSFRSERIVARASFGAHRRRRSSLLAMGMAIVSVCELLIRLLAPYFQGRCSGRAVKPRSLRVGKDARSRGRALVALPIAREIAGSWR